jgi:hypothetical protein
MANVIISFECGCGFNTPNPVSAVKHSEDNKHSLTIKGEVIKDKSHG